MRPKAVTPEHVERPLTYDLVGHIGAPNRDVSGLTWFGDQGHGPSLAQQAQHARPTGCSIRSDGCLAGGTWIATYPAGSFGGTGAWYSLGVILPMVRDPRLVTIRRGGTLTDSDHQLLALWAAVCAEHVLAHFETVRPGDERPARAIERGRAWARGEITMTMARTAGGHANGAARDLSGAPRFAAYAAAQAACVAHVAAHDLGAASYAIKAAQAAAPKGEGEDAGRQECRWQREQLPAAIRELVLNDQRVRNDICWSVFDC